MSRRKGRLPRVESAIHEIAARGFARAPAAYERGRPGYPEEAVACLLDVLGIKPGTLVLDLAGSQRRYAVRGRNSGLLDFSEAVCERLMSLKR